MTLIERGHRIETSLCGFGQYVGDPLDNRLIKQHVINTRLCDSDAVAEIRREHKL